MNTGTGRVRYKVQEQLQEAKDSLPETFSRFRVSTSLRTSCGSAVFGRPVTCICESGSHAVYRVSKEIPRPKTTETHKTDEYLYL